jgi:hypothetical protein
MRSFSQLSLACLVAAFASACSSPEQVINSPVPPTAAVRFINAVPDTGGGGGMDFRFVDRVENNAQPGILFRNSPVTDGGWTGSVKVQYKAAVAGTRYFKIFLNDTLQSVASTIMNTTTLPIDAASTAGVMPNDTTLVLGAGKLYTVILWGNARGGADAMRITAFEENVADPAANVALRVINATTTTVSADAVAGAATVATFTNVAPLSVSAYQTAAPASMNFNFTGGVTLSNQLAMPGVAGTVDQPAVPGTNVAGSAVTAIVWPRSTAGTTAPQTPTATWSNPQVTFIWDRRPPCATGPVVLC